MPFWLGFGISEEFERGNGMSVTVLEPGRESFGAAAESLEEVDLPVVSGRVTVANAYVVEANTQLDASSYLQTVFIEHESWLRVKLVQRDIPTRRRPAEPPEVEALSRVLGELSITHQITELALTRIHSNEQREQLDRHKGALEDFGYTVRAMRGDDLSTGDEGQSGAERLGYAHGQIANSQSATLDEALASLAAELSIATHEVDLATQVLSPSQKRDLFDMSTELQRFGVTVRQMHESLRISGEN